MAWLPISGIVPQATESGNQANGMVLKFYENGTLAPLTVATTSTGATTTTEFVLDTQGYTTLSGVKVIPHVDQVYKVALYLDQTDADADDTGSAVFVIDGVNVGNFSISTFADYSNLNDAIIAAFGNVGDFIITGEYTAGAGVGGGKYEIVAADPGNNLVNPAKTDGSGYFLKLMLDNPVIDLVMAGVQYDGTDEVVAVREAINVARTHEGSEASTGGRATVIVGGFVRIGSVINTQWDFTLFKGIGVSQSGFIWRGGALADAMFTGGSSSFGGFQDLRLLGYDKVDQTEVDAIDHVIKWDFVDLLTVFDNILLGSTADDAVVVATELVNFYARKLFLVDMNGYAFRINNTLGGDRVFNIDGFTIGGGNATLAPAGVVHSTGPSGVDINLHDARCEFNIASQVDLAAVVRVSGLNANSELHVNIDNLTGYYNGRHRGAPMLMIASEGRISYTESGCDLTDNGVQLEAGASLSTSRPNKSASWGQKFSGVSVGSSTLWEGRRSDRTNTTFKRLAKVNDRMMSTGTDADYLVVAPSSNLTGNALQQTALYTLHWSNDHTAASNATAVSGNTYIDAQVVADNDTSSLVYPVPGAAILFAGAGAAGAALYSVVTSVDRSTGRININNSIGTTIAAPQRIQYVTGKMQQRFDTPRTTTERSALTMAGTDDEGASLYDLTLNIPVYWNGSSWRKFSDNTAA